MKLYIAVLDTVPDYIVPTLVAHTILNAHTEFFITSKNYIQWYYNSFKKCVISVNQKEYDKIISIQNLKVFQGYENKTLDGKLCCAIIEPTANEELPNVLKFAKLWKPK